MNQPIHRRPRRLALAALAALTALTTACGGTPPEPPTASPTTLPTLTATALPTATPTATPSPTPEPLGERLKRSVVMVRVYSSPVPRAENLIASGSGFVARIGGRQVVVTVAHVTAGAASMTVAENGSTRERPARLLGSATCDDLAVLEVEDLTGLEPVALGQSAGLRLSDPVSVAGFPFGGAPGTPMTMTSGSISADRPVALGHLQELLQYTAATNPGASGAVVVDAAGQVIAIHSAGRGEGMNYGIAIDAALPVLEALAAGGQRDWLGVATEDAHTDSGDALLVVRAVDAAGPLGAAGALPGDIITALGDTPIHSADDLCAVLRASPERTTLPIQLVRLDGAPRGDLVGEVSISDPDGANWLRPASAVQILALSPGDVGQLQAAFAEARKGLRPQIFETFDNDMTKYNFLDQGQAHFSGGTYELTTAQPGKVIGALWQDRGRRPLSSDVPRQLNGVYLIEADVAFKTFDSTSGVGLTVDQQPNGDGIAFLINRDNTYQVITTVDGQATARYSSDRVPWPAMKGDLNTLRVVHTTTNIQFWINNTPVALLSELPFQGGGAGAAARGGADQVSPAMVIVDNVRIETP